MTNLKSMGRQIGLFETAGVAVFGIALVLVLAGRLHSLALIILVILGYMAYMTRGMVRQAMRFRPVEPPRAWWITLVANLLLMVIGLGAFGWYLAGGGSKAWIPFLIFIAGMMSLRLWRRDVVKKLYAWRTPALTLLQQGEYKKLIRALEDEATAGRGHPDKLAMVALAYIELNKWDAADQLLQQAKSLAPDFASVNGALGSLRRHQARYPEAADAIRQALAFEESASSRYYLGLCQYLAGDRDGARATLAAIIDQPDLIRQGQVVGAYLLGQIAEEAGGDSGAARVWYDRMADGAPKVMEALNDEWRRHKQTPYGETLKDLVRHMEQIIARRPLQPGRRDGAA